jgi:hypothetical protein
LQPYPPSGSFQEEHDQAEHPRRPGVLTWQQIPNRSDAELGATDPLLLNLLVAQGIPPLSCLDISHYTTQVDAWAADLRRRLPRAEAEFHTTPWDWKNDIHFFRLGMICWYVDQVLGIRYREDQRFVKTIKYTDAADLFVNGVIDTRRGTCATMPVLHVAMAWRLGWHSASLACAGPHIICRYDDGLVTFNIEATKNGGPGFHSHPDQFYIDEYKIAPDAIREGSDLAALRPRQLAGLFFSLRARHWQDTCRGHLERRDAVLAADLYPQNRIIRRRLFEVSSWRLDEEKEESGIDPIAPMFEQHQGEATDTDHLFARWRSETHADPIPSLATFPYSGPPGLPGE